MKQLILLIALLLVIGCAHSYEPVCRHNALFAAETVQDLTGQEVRLAIYKIDGKLRHVQAETQRDGKWRPLRVPLVTIYESGYDLPYEPESRCSVKLYKAMYMNWLYSWKQRNK